MCEIGGSCKTVNLSVYVQENGIIRLSDTGRYMGRLDEDEEVNFDNLNKLYGLRKEGKIMEKADSYYKLRLRPKHYDEFEPVEVYTKGDKKKLVQFLADIGDSFRVDILDVNTDGYTHQVGDES